MCRAIKQRIIVCVFWLTATLVCAVLSGCGPGAALGRFACQEAELPAPVFKLREPLFPSSAKTAVRLHSVVAVDSNSDLWLISDRDQVRFVRWRLGFRHLVDRPSGREQYRRHSTPLWKSVRGLTRRGRFAFVEATVRAGRDGDPAEDALVEVHGAVPVEDGILDLARVRCVGPVCGASGDSISTFLWLTGTDDLACLAGIQRDGHVRVWRRAEGGGYQEIFDCREPYACGLRLQGEPARLLVVLTTDGRIFGVDLDTRRLCWETRVARWLGKWAFDPDRPQVAISGLPAGVIVYEFTSDGVEVIYRLPSLADAVTSLSLHSRRLAVARGNGECEIYALSQGRVATWQAPARCAFVTLLPATERDSVLAVVHRDMRAEVYRLPAGERVGRLPALDVRGVTPGRLEFSAELRALLAEGFNGLNAWCFPSGRAAPWAPVRRTAALFGYLGQRRGRLLFQESRPCRTLWWYDPRTGAVESILLAPEVTLWLPAALSPSGQSLVVRREGHSVFGPDRVLALKYRGAILERKELLYSEAHLADCIWLGEDMLLCWRFEVRQPPPGRWPQKFVDWLLRRSRRPGPGLVAWFELWNVAEKPRKLWSVPSPSPGTADPPSPSLCALDGERVVFVADAGVGLFNTVDKRIRWLVPRSSETISWAVAVGGDLVAAVEQCGLPGGEVGDWRSRYRLHVISVASGKRTAYDLGSKLVPSAVPVAVDEGGEYIAVGHGDGWTFLWRASDLFAEVP